MLQLVQGAADSRWKGSVHNLLLIELLRKLCGYLAIGAQSGVTPACQSYVVGLRAGLLLGTPCSGLSQGTVCWKGGGAWSSDVGAVSAAVNLSCPVA